MRNSHQVRTRQSHTDKPMPTIHQGSRETSTPVQHLTPGSVLDLQRLIGNHAVKTIIARQPFSIAQPQIPIQLRNSVNLQTLSIEELQQRHDLVTDTLTQFQSANPNQTTVEMGELEAEAGRIGTELLRRDALDKGRTFEASDIEAMRDYFKANAKKTKPDSCIVCMNKGLKLLLGDPTQKTTPESIEKTMELLQKDKRAGAAKEIYFLDKDGKQTKGVRRPEKLPENIFATVLSMAGNDVGWSVFGLSLLDGYHSVTLALDNNDPSQPKIYWADQWSSKGGWKEYGRDELDKEIVSLVRGWWDDQPPKGKHTTVIRLWRLNQ